MQISTALHRTATAGLVMTAALVLSAGPTHAAQHSSWDPTGSVFSCPRGDVTVTGGDIHETLQFLAGADGSLRIIYTITPHDITAQDGSGTAYTIVGASHATAVVVGDELRRVTDTSHFVILGPDGVYGGVSLVDHYDPIHHTFTLTLGDCSAPQE